MLRKRQHLHGQSFKGPTKKALVVCGDSRRETGSVYCTVHCFCIQRHCMDNANAIMPMSIFEFNSENDVTFQGQLCVKLAYWNQLPWLLCTLSEEYGWVGSGSGRVILM